MTNNTTRQNAYTVLRNPVTGGVPAAGGLGGTHLETGGTFTCNGATPVTVVEPTVTANSSIIITLKTVGGTVSPSVPYIATITAGTGFTVTGTASDTSVYNYLVVG